MLPQTADLQVELTVDTYDEEGKLHVTWIPGRKYVYTVRISESEAVLCVETLN